MPAEGCTPSMFGNVACRFPEQRAIRKNPDRIVAQSREDGGCRQLVIGVRKAGDLRIARRLRNIAVAEGDKEGALGLLKLTASKIDKAASKGVLHSSTAARTISRLSRAVGKLS